MASGGTTGNHNNRNTMKEEIETILEHYGNWIAFSGDPMRGEYLEDDEAITAIKNLVKRAKLPILSMLGKKHLEAEEMHKHYFDKDQKGNPFYIGRVMLMREIKKAVDELEKLSEK